MFSKRKKNLSVTKKVVLLHPHLRKRSFTECKRFGSSVWLEYMPVTHGVASSSLVRTAKQRSSLLRAFFVRKSHGADWF